MLLRRYLRDTLTLKRHLIEAMLLMGFISAIQLLLPQFIRKMLDDYIPNKKLHEALVYFLLIVGAFLIRGVMLVRRNHQMLNFGYRFIYDMRMRIMRQLQLLSSRYFDKVPMGDTLTRMLDDIMNVENMTTNSLLNLVTDGIIIIGVLIMLFYMEWSLALAALCIMPFYILNFRYFRVRLRKRYKEIQQNYSALSSEFSESLSGIKIIKSFSLDEFKGRQLEQYVGQDVALRIRAYTMNAVFSVISEFLTILGTALILFYGGYLVMNGRISVGEVVAFYTYVGYLYHPLQQIVSMTQVIQRGLTSAERVYELLDISPWPVERKDAVDLSACRGELEFRNVCFTYEGMKEPTLSDISFEVRPGKMVALVGSSGAGKTTILNLVLRFYDPRSGEALIDGKDLKLYKIASLRNQMATVLQEGFLFSGTVCDNIRMGRLDACDREVEEAAKTANIWEFIQSLPDGMRTILGVKGVNLSGGQKQLIAIARAMLRGAPLVLLDEPTSAMDSVTEFMIHNALSHLRQERSVIIIAHRLSTIMTADEILVMRKGRIEERGAHHELLAMNGFYKQLYDLQFAPQEKLFKMSASERLEIFRDIGTGRAK